jgi:prevent-host-death family protein
MIDAANVFPVTDLRKNFAEIESITTSGEPVLLTKNGRSSMVVLDSKTYDQIQEKLLESDLDVAEFIMENTTNWRTHNEVFSDIREKIQNA